MITDASAIPSSTAGNAFLNFMPSSAASREPVHAPVPGSGIPTNSTRPQNSLFFYLLTLTQSTGFHLLNHGTEGLRLFEPVKDRCDQQQDERNRNNISDNADPQCSG